MKELLENYIKCSDNYVDLCYGLKISEHDEDAGQILDNAGKALRKAAKAQGVDMAELKKHMITFISANVHRKTSNKDVAAHYEERTELRIQLLKNLLGIK
ncbi:hypothetical protein MN04_00237 [Escherichia phage MN04]|uniref:Uncharacterized protein n=1 Tax=Escherichia phage MN04 TaxID=2711184 RepID=A0A858I6U2_9CAUD|nr:hypothetical protein MN04_00237 [Escherichia phage MN04]